MNKALKHTIYITFIFIFAMTCAAFGQSNMKSISLLKAVEIALERDNNIKAVIQEKSAANLGIRKAKADYWPKLSLSGNYAHLSKVNEMVIDLPVGGSQTFAIGTDNPFSSDLMLGWDVYTFGRRGSLVGIAKTESELTGVKESFTQKQVFDNVARAYLAVVFSDAAYELSTTEKDRASKILKLVENRYEKKLIPEFDLLQMQLRYEQHRLTELELEEDNQTARLNLARLLNMGNESLPSLSDNLDYEFSQLMPLHKADDVLEYRDDYEQAEIQLRFSDYTKRITRSGYFPNVTLFTDYNLRNGYQPDLDNIENVFSFGVNFNWLLFDGLSRRAEINRQAYLKKASEYYRDDLKDLIPFQVSVASNTLIKKKSAIEVGKRALEVAQKAMAIARKRYELGDISMIELLEAENKLSEAELGLLKLQFDKAIAELDLKAASGYYPEIETFNR